MPNKALLETYPLYKRMKLTLAIHQPQWPRPAIVAHCVVCGSPQTYVVISDYAQHDEAKPKAGAGGYLPAYSSCVKIVYQCAACSRTRRYFLVQVAQKQPRNTGGMVPPEQSTEAEIQKVGQFPPWDIAPDPLLSKKLGTRVDLLKKGLICESQGYGIAAFAYYRRILETLIDELLGDIGSLVSAEAHADYAAAVERAQSSYRAKDKIEHVKDLVPASLRPGEANPLALLHTALSEGLHTLAEEECLERAGIIRGALVFLVAQVSQQKSSTDQFTRDLKALVARQAARITPSDDPSEPTTT